MNALRRTFLGLSICILLAAPALSRAQPAGGTKAKRPALDLVEMTAIPEGNYLVTLEVNGKNVRLNLMIKDNAALCMNTSDPQYKAVQGRFELIGNGVFVARLKNDKITASQLWLFRPDGTARIKESPDRGEKQQAVPVETDSLDAKPKG